MATLRATYIGDAFTASGFALVGVRPRVVPARADDVWRTLCAARRDSDLVIVNQAHAEAVGARLRELIVAEPTPPVIVVPTMNHDEAARDRVVGPARRVLGLG